MTAFVSALLMGCSFGVDYDVPFRLEEVLQPNFLPWTNANETRYRALVKAKWGAPWFIESRGFQNAIPEVARAQAALFERFGFRAEWDLDRLYACLFDFLFEPSARVRALVAQELAEVDHTREDLLCAQLRFGGDTSGKTGVSFDDSFQFNVLEQLPQVWRFLRDLVERELAPVGREFKVFVTTDSDHAKEIAIAEWGDRLLHVPGEITHVDRSAAHRQTLDTFAKVAADNYMLGFCDSAVISKSGMGALGLWRAPLKPGRAWLWENGQIRPYAHAYGAQV